MVCATGKYNPKPWYVCATRNIIHSHGVCTTGNIIHSHGVSNFTEVGFDIRKITGCFVTL